MQLPVVANADRYRGLYVYDFGDWSAVGYTAEEIAILLEDPATAGGGVYRIMRATPDGRMELRGVAAERFQLESAMLFYRRGADQARDDFAALTTMAQETPPPCRAFVHLADRGAAAGPTRYVTALIYPAEQDEEIARWLLDRQYAGGDTVEGGVSPVGNYYDEEKTILERQQLWSAHTIPSRSREEVLASTRRAVQR